MKTRLGFTVFEVLLSVLIAALITAVLGSVLVNSLRAQRQAHAVLQPQLEIQTCFALLRDDLIAAPRPNAAQAAACVLESVRLGGREADRLQFTSGGAHAYHPELFSMPVQPGQELISWWLEERDDAAGLVWLRSRQPHVLATGTPPDASAEIMLDNLAYLSLEVLHGDNWQVTYNSDEVDAVLPQSLRISFAFLNDAGEAGDEQIIVINLPQVLLDPVQMAGS